MSSSLVKTDPPPKPQIVGSLAEMQKGQLVYLDKHGRPMSTWKRRTRAALVWTYAAGAWTAAGLSVGGLAGVGLVVGGVAFTAYLLRLVPPIRAANALLASQRYEEALAAYQAIEARQLMPSVRRSVSGAIVGCELALGRPEAGLVRLDAILARTRRPWLAASQLNAWRLRMTRVQVLARLGRLAEARRQLEDAGIGIGARLPASDFGQLITQLVTLELAFHEDAPARLPDDATLHEWARAALGRSGFGVGVILLAWAFHRRGDDEMAKHLLAEAPARLQSEHLGRVLPRLVEWADSQRVAWGLPAPAAADQG
jgi:hypothetical protein